MIFCPWKWLIRREDRPLFCLRKVWTTSELRFAIRLLWALIDASSWSLSLIIFRYSLSWRFSFWEVWNGFWLSELCREFTVWVDFWQTFDFATSTNTKSHKICIETNKAAEHCFDPTKSDSDFASVRSATICEIISTSTLRCKKKLIYFPIEFSKSEFEFFNFFSSEIRFLHFSFSFAFFWSKFSLLFSYFSLFNKSTFQCNSCKFISISAM